VKGVVLVGGTGTRLAPLTTVTNKHLLPIHDKPMVFYPLECLVKSGIDDILIVTGGNNAGDFLRLLRDGQSLGIKSLRYAYQEGSGGIADALSLAERFAEDDRFCLILGDNIVERAIGYAVEEYRQQRCGARVLLTPVENPEAFGIAELRNGKIARIVEKPRDPMGNQAVVGIYFYDQRVFEIARTQRPSKRGELEITDVNNAYLERGELQYTLLQGWWADAGDNIDSYLATSSRVGRCGANRTGPFEAPGGHQERSVRRTLAS